MRFEDLGLAEKVLKGVQDKGFETATDIQAQAIPLILEGRDVIGASQTGTGKTAAFALPVLTLLGQHTKNLRCLVLEPTRELAAQVQEHFEELGANTELTSTLIYGGVGYGTQTDALKEGVDIAIATPGRLLDHLEKRTCNLKSLDVLILDEVDRMLDMGFLPSVRKILDQCPDKRQTLFFSATMPPAIQTFAAWALKDPVEIEIGHRRGVAETVSHAFYPVSIDQRDDLLMTLLERTNFSSVMIFTRTKREADALYALVKRTTDHTATVMHSDIRQRDREAALRGFRSGEFDVIIATDVAARGLDISGVSHVINYRVPENAEDYVHRIGRTGRAKTEGDAFTILSAEELDFATSIERFIDQKIERRRLENFDYIYTTLLDEKPPGVRTQRPRPKRRRRR